jgi:hypothetical protein
MDENLVGYLLNALDEPTHGQVEAYLRNNPEAQKRLDTLRRALEPLALDKEIEDPPPGLTFRTVARVAEYRSRPVAEPPAAPPVTIAAPTERRWWHRRVDVLVAAAIIVVAGGLFFQTSGTLRATQARMECANNLRNFHQGLTTFASTHNGVYPGVPFQQRYPDPNDGARSAYSDPKMNVAGIFVPEMRQAGCLGSDMSVRCPGNGSKLTGNHTLEELAQILRNSPEEFDRIVEGLACCYAYSLGYRTPGGWHCNLARDLDNPDLTTDLMPIMADRPGHDGNGTPTNTSNHPGGQNVLHVGGHVLFYRHPNNPTAPFETDNIYLNREKKVGAGVDRWDTCLGASGDKP